MSPIGFKTLYEQIQSCPGMKYYRLVLSYRTSQHIFSGNFKQLRELLQFIHDPERSFDKLFTADKSREMTLAQNEVVRLFHNFVASAMTLIEHTRIMIRDDSVKKGAIDEYQEKIEVTFTNNTLAGFIQDLRNYILHKGIPFTGVELKWTAENKKYDTRVFLDLSQMKTWDKWSERGRTYIDNAGAEKITLLEVVEAYTAIVQSFHEWYHNWFMELHKAELEEFRALQKVLNEGIEGREKASPATG